MILMPKPWQVLAQLRMVLDFEVRKNDMLQRNILYATRITISLLIDCLSVKNGVKRQNA